MIKITENKKQTIQTDKNIIVLYHAHCPDGMAGAWAAKNKFGNDAEYIPIKKGEGFPIFTNINSKEIGIEQYGEIEIYVIDFSFTIEEIKEVESKCKKLVIIDHHISSREEVESAHNYVFDLDHSGCYLAWEYFYPNMPVPLLLQYISEGDIFKYRLADHEKYMPAIYGRELSFENIDMLNEMMNSEEGREKLKEQSGLLKNYEKKILAASLDSVHMIELEGVVMPAVNVCLPIDERSDLLHMIYTKYPPVAMSYRWDDGQWKMSLRSNGDFDCTIIATKYGGGGHKGSAGFAVAGDMPLPFAKASPSPTPTPSANTFTPTPALPQVEGATK